MADTGNRASDEQRHSAHRHAVTDPPEHANSAYEAAPSYPAPLLGDCKLNGRGNAPVQTALMLQMQRKYGNRAVQRFLQRTVARQTATAESAVSIQRSQCKPEREEENPLKSARHSP